MFRHCFFRGKLLRAWIGPEGSITTSEFVLDVSEASLKKTSEWTETAMKADLLLAFGIISDSLSLVKRPCMVYMTRGKLSAASLAAQRCWKHVDLVDINVEDLLHVKISRNQIFWLTRSGNVGIVTRPSYLDEQQHTLSLTDARLCGQDVSKLWLPNTTFPEDKDCQIELLSFKKHENELKFKAYEIAVEDGQVKLSENRSLECMFPTGYESFCLALSSVILEGNRMIIIATVDQKLLLCGNQAVYKTCHIPIQVQSIDTAIVNKSMIAILQSHDGSVVIVNCHNFEVIGNYSNISKWLVGDFTHCGHQQLILFTSDSVEGGFVLTDFESCHMTLSSNMTKAVENIDDDPDCPDGLIQALDALHNRLATAKVHMVDKKLLLSNKRRLLQGAATQLPKLPSDWNNESTPHWFVDPSLVRLIGKEDKPGRKTRNYGKSTSKEVILRVKDEWQRCVYDKWVIAVEVENVTEHFISRLAFHLSSLVGHDGVSSPVSSQNYIIVIQADSDISNQTETDDEPVAKKKRIDITSLTNENEFSSSNNCLAPGRRATLLAVTDCPSFGGSSTVTATSCITFNVIDSLESTVSSSLQSCKLESLTIHRQCQLSLQQLVDGDFTVQPDPELLGRCNDTQTLHSQVAFQTVALHCSLKVTMDVSDKFGVIGSLLRISGQDFSDSKSVPSILFKSVHMSPQCDVLLSIDSCPENPRSFLVHVFYQSPTALSDFLCSFCQRLAPDALICCHTRDDSKAKSVSIEEETQRLNNFLQRVVIDSRGSDNVSIRVYLKDYKHIMCSVDSC